jgi:hypothetical protein
LACSRSLRAGRAADSCLHAAVFRPLDDLYEYMGRAPLMRCHAALAAGSFAAMALAALVFAQNNFDDWQSNQLDPCADRDRRRCCNRIAIATLQPHAN